MGYEYDGKFAFSELDNFEPSEIGQPLELFNWYIFNKKRLENLIIIRDFLVNVVIYSLYQELKILRQTF